MPIITYRFFPLLIAGRSNSSSSSSSGIMSSRNSNRSLSSANFLYSSSLKPSSCFSNFFEIEVSNLRSALLLIASRSGRRCWYFSISLLTQLYRNTHCLHTVNEQFQCSDLVIIHSFWHIELAQHLSQYPLIFFWNCISANGCQLNSLYQLSNLFFLSSKLLRTSMARSN